MAGIAAMATKAFWATIADNLKSVFCVAIFVMRR